MTVRTGELINGQPVVKPVTRGYKYKVAAALIWLGAVYTTYLALDAIQPGTPWFIILPIAAGLQYVFTMAERPILHGKIEVFTGAVLVIDGAINAGGLFPMLRNVGQTPTAQMIAAGGVSSDVGSLPAILLSFVFGLIIAAAPEALWKMRD